MQPIKTGLASDHGVFPDDRVLPDNRFLDDDVPVNHGTP